VKFVVNGMLGKVARWLRMLGYDTKYFNAMSDDEILKVASEEKRILLTRDYQFLRRLIFMVLGQFLLKEKTILRGLLTSQSNLILSLR